MSSQGERVKKIRQSLNLSQDELGSVLGIGKQFISKIENNVALLNNDKLVTLLVNYNVNINYILGGVGEMFNTAPQNTSTDKEEIIKIVEDYLIKRSNELNR